MECSAEGNRQGEWRGPPPSWEGRVWVDSNGRVLTTNATNHMFAVGLTPLRTPRQPRCPPRCPPGSVFSVPIAFLCLALNSGVGGRRPRGIRRSGYWQESPGWSIWEFLRQLGPSHEGGNKGQAVGNCPSPRDMQDSSFSSCESRFSQPVFTSQDGLVMLLLLLLSFPRRLNPVS